MNVKTDSFMFKPNALNKGDIMAMDGVIYVAKMKKNHRIRKGINVKKRRTLLLFHF